MKGIEVVQDKAQLNTTAMNLCTPLKHATF
jgi:hypothetical protein